MKLVNKFLTALAPVAMVGVITPTLVACNKGSSYTFKYGDDVNCLKKELGHYHSRKDVKNAVKAKINIEPKNDVKLVDINTNLGKIEDEIQIQYLYYELIASKVWCNNENVSVINWPESISETIIFDYCTASTTITKWSNDLWFHYTSGDGEAIKEVYIEVNGLTKFKSYAYSYCTIKEE